MPDIEEGLSVPSDDFIQAVLGTTHPIESVLLYEAAVNLNPTLQRERDNAHQIQELYQIKRTADFIERDFESKELPLPEVFIIYTAGFNVPKETLDVATYSIGPLVHLMPADIGGHLGTAGALKLDDNHTAMVFSGRAHPYAGVGQPYAELNYARPFNVIKELMRRQRARGKQSAAVFTYLTGVDENAPLRPGDLGIVMDHTEAAGGRAGLSAGAGPRNLLDSLIGARFQPKLGRASDAHLSLTFHLVAKNRGVRTGPVAAIGTPGTTSYQGYLDRGLALAAFERVQNDLNTEVQNIFGPHAADTSLFFDMALSFELDAVRQVLIRENTETKQTYTEQDFPLIALVLPTDIVGSGSSKVDHAAVVAEAFRHGERNGELIQAFAQTIVTELNTTHPVDNNIPEWVLPKFSLQDLLPEV